MTIKSTIFYGGEGYTGGDKGIGPGKAGKPVFPGRGKPMFGQGPQFASDIPGTPHPLVHVDLSADDIANYRQSPDAKRQSNQDRLGQSKGTQSYEDKERKDRYNEQMGRFAPDKPTSEVPDRFPADPGWQDRTPLTGNEDDFKAWEREQE